jgi:hypothetical protein
MQFVEVLKKSLGETVVINNNEERTLMAVEEDFIVLSGGNPQMKLTDFVPIDKIVKVIRADYSTGASSISIDVLVSGGDQRRASSH